MLKTLIDTAKFSDIMEIVSPALFRVMPVGGLRRVAGKLTRNRISGKRYERATAERAESLEGLPIDVTLGPISKSSAKTERSDGAAILELYFTQLFDDAPVILDLRRDRFARDGDQLVWEPKAYFVDFDPDFKEAMAGVYEGFYTDDDALFESSLETLGLDSVAHLFRAHFGEGDQAAVEFDVDVFRTTFMQIFEHCKEQGIELHHDFVALGINLATLYEHLGTLGGTFDVRSAYFAARDAQALRAAS